MGRGLRFLSTERGEAEGGRNRSTRRVVERLKTAGSATRKPPGVRGSAGGGRETQRRATAVPPMMVVRLEPIDP